MKKYDFDAVVERRGTNSIKYDFAVEFGYPADVLPLWVADMDFKAPPCVTEALSQAVEHGIFGYSMPKEDYYDAAVGWFLRRFGWETEREWLVTTPGVVFAVNTAVRALTEKGDAVLIQPPVYYPFSGAVTKNGRRLVTNELVYSNGRYEIDFDDFEAKIRDNSVKMFVLCSPHNPVGRVWTRDELRKIGEICGRYGVIAVSDEIHCDFAFPEHPHTVFARACPEMADRAVICTAPSKTFNLAGLQVSNIWIPGGGLREKFRGLMDREGLGGVNRLGMIAAQAAYKGGEEWLDEVKEYMRGNLDFLRQFLRERLPEVKLVEPEGTYFAWLDCSGLGHTGKELNDRIVNRAKLWLDAGDIFGKSGEQFQRVVLACPRATLQQAAERLCKLKIEN